MCLILLLLLTVCVLCSHIYAYVRVLNFRFIAYIAKQSLHKILNGIVY